jgi:hypothetical protein
MHRTKVYFFIIAISLSLLTQVAVAIALNFNVPKNDEVVRSLTLAVDDHVSIKFTVTGQTEKVLDFRIQDPNGDIIVEHKKVGTINEKLVCVVSGEYYLYFSNLESSEEKFVTLNYEIGHYIFGIPQMLFLTMIIALLCMGLIATFVMLGKTY